MTLTVDAIVERLHDEGDPAARDELATRYGIHTDDAVGMIPLVLLMATGAYLLIQPHRKRN